MTNTIAAPKSREKARNGCIFWQPLRALPIFCELYSGDEDVLRQARLLFAPCRDAPCLNAKNEQGRAFAVWRWNVEKDEDVWRVCDFDSGETFSGDLQRVLMRIEYSIVQRLVEAVRREDAQNLATPLFAMHAALLEKDGFGIVIVGPSESGKSTLTCALWQNGWTIASDDFCFVQGEQVFPAARRVSLRRGSRALLGEEVWNLVQKAPSSAPTSEGLIFHPHQVRLNEADANPEVPARDAVTIRAILFLGRLDPLSTTQTPAAQSEMANKEASELVENGAVAVRFCNPARAALALLPYCTLVRAASDDDSHSYRVLDWGKALPKIAPLMSRVPVLRMARGELAQMVAAVENLAAEICAASSRTPEALARELRWEKG